MSALRRTRLPHVGVFAASFAALTLTLAVGCGGKDSPSSPTPTPTPTATPASPTVSAITPNSGSAGGGTAVTITGANFATGATVTIGGTAATGVTVASATSITATTPAHAAGAVDVVVTNPDSRSGTLTGAFTYTGGALTIASLSPNSGPITGGTTVTITGTNFVSGATVRFGTAQGNNVTFVSSTSIRADTPAASTTGAVDVVVTLPSGGTATLTNGFAYNVNQIAGNWAGTTPQTTQVTFTVNGSTITAYSVQYVISGCPAATTVSATNTSVPVSNNSFSRTATLTSNGANIGTLTFSGSFSSNTVATGNIQVTETAPSPCPGSLSTTWRATRQ